MHRRETERLLDAIRQAQAAREPVAVATVVRVLGSAYRREGTRMLVRRNGTYECALSGGCLEPSVAEAALHVIETGTPRLVRYDLADDSLWGLGMGCSGAVDIRIERLEDDQITRAWLTLLETGTAVVLVTALSGASGRLLVRATGEIAGSLDDSAIERAAAARAGARLSAPFPRSGSEPIGSCEVFFDIDTPPPDLVIFGAGPDTVPLAQQAWMLGFAVTIVDVRTAYLTADRFPAATRVAAHFSQFADKVRLPPGGIALVMNHHVERDRESLRFALESRAAYIGVLGPRSRYQKLLTDLAAQGCVPSASSLSRVRSPVGLSLGAETPEEIAVSILGEILAIRRGFEGGFLSGSVRSLHRPEATAVETDFTTV
jgi:xanthine/CO dehydrogenase XdhC/CoxF family maturation factor